jgi:hypothetical protein
MPGSPPTRNTWRSKQASSRQTGFSLAHAPLAFKRRNIYTPSVDLPLSLHAGRPRKPQEEKKRSNAERQRRFRKKLQVELIELRKLVREKTSAR